MRTVIGLCIASLAALATLSCAHEGPASRLHEAPADSVPAADSLEALLYDDLFIEEHGALIEELDKREKEGEAIARVIEARSLVSAAEEMYLVGKVRLAIRLLDEAEVILRRDN